MNTAYYIDERLLFSATDEDRISDRLEIMRDNSLAKGTYRGYRMFFLLHLLRATGLRIQEALDLRARDVDLDRRNLHVESGKRGKRRQVKYSKRFSMIIRHWISCWDILPEDYLIWSCRARRPLSPSAAWRIYRRTVAGPLGIDGGFHRFRHTYASLLYRKTKNLILVKRQLGHARIETSARYSHLADGELEAGVESLEG